MSLAKLPLRIATVLALRDLTWAGASVFDSTIVPIDTKVADEKGMLFLVVYTESSHGSGHPGHDMTGFCPNVDIVIHAAVATSFSGTAAGTSVEIARSDAGFEAQLDIVEAQIVRVLQRDTGPWADLWRAFARDHGEVRTRRGASARKGQRFAAREIIIPVDAVPDPVGVAGDYPWNIAVERFAAEPDLTDLSAILAGFCSDGVGLPEWRSFAGASGLDVATARAFGFATADGEDVVFT